MSTYRWIPLFPLNTVLFPLGILPLRVFEPRYMDMVRNCMRNETPFGVVLIHSGQETGTPATTEKIGCMAHIRHWDMQELGVLLLQTQGGSRFRIIATRETPDHRLEGQIEMLDDDMPTQIDELHAGSISTLQEVIDEVKQQGEAEQGEDFMYPFPLPTRIDDAGWVAYRWSEVLPLPLAAKQRLLAIEDPFARLEAVEEHLLALGVIQDLAVPMHDVIQQTSSLH